jgi:hypothetical protein
MASMFKKLVPVIALALIAGPVLAADAPAGDTSTPAKTSHKHSGKHHGSSSKKSGSKSTDTSTAPAK